MQFLIWGVQALQVDTGNVDGNYHIKENSCSRSQKRQLNLTDAFLSNSTSLLSHFENSKHQNSLNRLSIQRHIKIPARRYSPWYACHPFGAIWCSEFNPILGYCSFRDSHHEHPWFEHELVTGLLARGYMKLDRL